MTTRPWRSGAVAGFLFSLVFVTALLGQETELVRVTHRFDWRRSVDQTYQGLVYGYMTGAWKLSQGTRPGWTDVEARYYQASESRRNNVLLEKPIDAEKLSRFKMDPKGTMTDFSGDGVPYYRNFPAPLPTDAASGSVWTGTGELAGDFLGTGQASRIPILIEYRWEGPGQYLGRQVIQVKTQYALRYSAGDSSLSGDPTLSRAEGTHQGMVSYDAITRKVLFIRETAQESFVSTNGHKIANEGILLTFFEDVPSLGVAAVVQNLNQALAEPSEPKDKTSSGENLGVGMDSGLPASKLPSDTPDVRVEVDPRGVKLTLDNLKFVADQATLLPGEDKRLAKIAGLLKTVPDRNLLVVGHTAAVGTPESQDKLSIDRAKSIVDKLKGAGIPPNRLLYEGRGGREPVASNDTEPGKAQNRRVEILILDQ